jgi:hypothetical protein
MSSTAPPYAVAPFSFATQGFNGGINIRDSPDQLQPGDLWKCENVVFDNAGGLAKRLGERTTGPVGVGTERIISAYTFYRPGSNPQVLVHTSAGKMYYTSDVTATAITWTQVVAGLSTTVPAAFETQNSKVYFAEGTLLGSWDGTTYAAVGGAPSGIYYLRTWKDTMWATTTGNPDRLYSSAAGDPGTWPALNYVDILHGDGDSLTCLASDGLFLVAFKRRRAQVVYDPASFANRTADFEKGCESHFSVVHMEDKMYYLSRLGVCWWQGDSSSRLISYKIDPLFRPGNLNLSALGNVFAYQLNDRCGWALPEAGSSVPTLTIEYYPRLGQVYQISGNIGPGPWSMHRLNATAFTTVRQGTIEQLFGGSNTANILLWIFSPDGTDNGATIVSTVQSGALSLGSPTLTKYLRRVKVVGRGKFSFQVKRNYEVGPTVTAPVNLLNSYDLWGGGNWGAGNWGISSDVQQQVINLDVYGKAFSIAITDSETATGLQNFPMGSKLNVLTVGEWAIYNLAFDCQTLGLRG